ncbi:MAG: hypothetical protein FWF59_04310 [Turicibacter sp.]|nr:hypothetical protein [Turicibacter sp.]
MSELVRMKVKLMADLLMGGAIFMSLVPLVVLLFGGRGSQVREGWVVIAQIIIGLRGLSMLPWGFFQPRESWKLSAQFGLSRKTHFMADLLSLFITSGILVLVGTLSEGILETSAYSVPPLIEFGHFLIIGGIAILSGCLSLTYPKLSGLPYLAMMAILMVTGRISLAIDTYYYGISVEWNLPFDSIFISLMAAAAILGTIKHVSRKLSI